MTCSHCGYENAPNRHVCAGYGAARPALRALAALGAHSIWLQGEMEAGIARGVLLGGLAPGLPVITKSGGFGDDGALVEAIETLARAMAA